MSDKIRKLIEELIADNDLSIKQKIALLYKQQYKFDEKIFTTTQTSDELKENIDSVHLIEEAIVQLEVYGK